MLQRYNFYLSFAKKWAKNLQDSKNTLTFAAYFKTLGHWRDGRVVDYSGLENRRAERHRGFESLSLRQNILKSLVNLVFTRDFCFLVVWL